jgi:L-ascorbate metabolism protein UlaG (beta-lactamase superfamily)
MKTRYLHSAALVLALAVPAFVAAQAQQAQAPVPAQSTLTPKDDAIPTAKGNAVVHPIGHASVLITWDNKKILVDPAPSAMTGGTGGGGGGGGAAAGGGRGAAGGGAAAAGGRGAGGGGGGRGGAAAPAAPPLSEAALAPFKALGTPDVVLITHTHGDHFNVQVLTAVAGPNTVLGVPQAIYNMLTPELKAKATIMGNGDTSMLNGIEVQAVAMYNTTPERTRNHPEGQGNGYVVTLGGKRFYFAGDTEETPELKNLPNIDVAFIPMNLPYTQTPEAAGAWVRDFKPKIVYPYHFSNGDLTPFVAWVGNVSEVRIRKWY